MATARGHGGWQLVRPLLALPKADLLAYAQAHQLTWIEDPSNDLTAFARNRVRREVLPALIRAVPGAVGNLNRAARLAREAQAVLPALVPVAEFLDVAPTGNPARLQTRHDQLL
jgi:tRNA(Ile)-lysidine synthase